MARKFSKIELRRLITSYINDPASVDFSRLSLEQKRELFALAYRDCHTMLNSKAIGIGGLIDKFMADFVAYHKAELGRDDKVQQLFKEITDANKYAVEYPVETDERDALADIQSEFKKFRIDVEGKTKKTGFKLVLDDVNIMNEGALDTGFTTLLGTYEKAYGMYSRFSNINTICIDEPIKAKGALDKYNGLGGNVSGIDMAEIDKMLKEHRYSEVHKIITGVISSYNRKNDPNPEADPFDLTPPANDKKKKGFFRRLGEAILRRPVITGTIAFAVALPIAGAISLTALPSFFLWGAVGLAAGGNGLKAIAKAVVPGYRRFIYNYDIDRENEKIVVNKARLEKLQPFVESALKKNKPVSLEKSRNYIAPGIDAGILSWVKGKKLGLQNAIADGRGKAVEEGMDLSNLTVAEMEALREYKKIQAENTRRANKVERKGKKLIKADRSDIDAYTEDSKRIDEIIAKATSGDKIVEKIKVKKVDKTKKAESYKKGKDSVQDGVVEIVNELLSKNKYKEALEYVTEDMEANNGKQNPELMKLVKEKAGNVGVQFLVAKRMEDVVGDDKYKASEKALKYIDADDAQKLSMEVHLRRSLAATYGEYYYKTKKSKKSLNELMDQHDDFSLKQVANKAYDDAKKEASTPPEERFVGDDFFK